MMMIEVVVDVHVDVDDRKSDSWGEEKKPLLFFVFFCSFFFFLVFCALQSFNLAFYDLSLQPSFDLHHHHHVHHP